MNLGYCVVFHSHEQGESGKVVVVTNQNLDEAVSLVETLSGYKADHFRYKQKIFDLGVMYHRKALSLLNQEELKELKNYSL